MESGLRYFDGTKAVETDRQNNCRNPAVHASRWLMMFTYITFMRHLLARGYCFNFSTKKEIVFQVGGEAEVYTTLGKLKLFTLCEGTYTQTL